MLTPREKSPLPENVPRGGSNPRRCGQGAQTLPTELFRPQEEEMTASTIIKEETTQLADQTCKQKIKKGTTRR